MEVYCGKDILCLHHRTLCLWNGTFFFFITFLTITIIFPTSFLLLFIRFFFFITFFFTFLTITILFHLIQWGGPRAPGRHRVRADGDHAAGDGRAAPRAHGSPPWPPDPVHAAPPSVLSPAPRPSGAYRPSGAPHGRGHAAAGLPPPRPAPARAAPRPRLQGEASPGSPPSSLLFPASLVPLPAPPHTVRRRHSRPRRARPVAASGCLLLVRGASRARLAVLHRPRQPSASAFASYAPSTRGRRARHRAPTRPAVGSPFRATPAPPLYHRRLPHLTAHLTRPSSPPLGARAAEAGSRRRLRARAAAAPVQVAAPPLLSTTGNEVKGERTPADGNTSPDPVGFRTGHHAAGAAPPSSLPARGSPPAEGLLEGSSKQWVGCLVIPLRHVSDICIPQHSFAFVVMHIDLASELSTQELLMIKKPDNKLNPKQEDDVSLSWPSLCIDYDQG
ncbi:hypothetical protein U9M48_032745 [Paspalum notatum var. saurae]|uniref:Uncharacterized protein n=1 Tax=Paspalum notatum var. saurae TaxID=547442 RepID=A0AAQ3X571_PASNO